VLGLEAFEAQFLLALGGEGLGLALGFHLGEVIADVGKFLESR
jgi:hypothetical protein